MEKGDVTYHAPIWVEQYLNKNLMSAALFYSCLIKPHPHIPDEVD